MSKIYLNKFHSSKILFNNIGLNIICLSKICLSKICLSKICGFLSLLVNKRLGCNCLIVKNAPTYNAEFLQRSLIQQHVCYFQSSLIFVVKTRTLPLLVFTVSLPTNIRLWCMWLLAINALAYNGEIFLPP